jgi:hypothetical protein
VPKSISLVSENTQEHQGGKRIGLRLGQLPGTASDDGVGLGGESGYGGALAGGRRGVGVLAVVVVPAAGEGPLEGPIPHQALKPFHEQISRPVHHRRPSPRGRRRRLVTTAFYWVRATRVLTIAIRWRRIFSLQIQAIKSRALAALACAYPPSKQSFFWAAFVEEGQPMEDHGASYGHQQPRHLTAQTVICCVNYTLTFF